MVTLTKKLGGNVMVGWGRGVSFWQYTTYLWVAACGPLIFINATNIAIQICGMEVTVTSDGQMLNDSPPAILLLAATQIARGHYASYVLWHNAIFYFAGMSKTSVSRSIAWGPCQQQQASNTVYLFWTIFTRPSKSTWPAEYCSITSLTSYGFNASLNFRLATKYFIWIITKHGVNISEYSLRRYVIAYKKTNWLGWSLTLRMARIAPLCWFVRWIQRGSSSSSETCSIFSYK